MKIFIIKVKDCSQYFLYGVSYLLIIRISTLSYQTYDLYIHLL